MVLNEAYKTIRSVTSKLVRQNSCEKRYSNCLYLRSLIMITKGQKHVCVRLKAEVGWVP